ncbi:MAG: Asp-tRNA(Asn)/Glu-tRNA(Gln) amidotransferase subunit GatC [Sporichthyaceae bacterium]
MAGTRPTLTGEDVAHLAHLSRLDLSLDERERMAGQLQVILHAVARVGEVATDDVPPMSHAVGLTNVLRPDVVRPGLTPDQALSGAPAAQDQRFRVPRILGEDQ